MKYLGEGKCMHALFVCQLEKPHRVLEFPPHLEISGRQLCPSPKRLALRCFSFNESSAMAPFNQITPKPAFLLKKMF